jgi:transposase
VLIHCRSNSTEIIIRDNCAKAEYRTISRDPREHLLEAMRQRLKTEKGKQMKKDRSAKAEAPFGNSKHNKEFTHLLLRGTKYAGVEFTLLCIALNIEKIYTYTRAHGIDLKTA